jgi:hypothetical protein
MTELFTGNLTWLYLISFILFCYLAFKIIRRPEWGLSIVFFATGILLSPKLPVVREKLSSAEFFMLLIWLSILLKPGGTGGKKPFTQNQKNALILGNLFITWTAISYVINATFNPLTIMDSSVEMANFIYGYLMFITVLFMARDWQKWESCLNGWLWGSAIVSFFGLLA